MSEVFVMVNGVFRLSSRVNQGKGIVKNERVEGWLARFVR